MMLSPFPILIPLGSEYLPCDIVFKYFSSYLKVSEVKTKYKLYFASRESWFSPGLSLNSKQCSGINRENTDMKIQFKTQQIQIFIFYPRLLPYEDKWVVTISQQIWLQKVDIKKAEIMCHLSIPLSASN